MSALDQAFIKAYAKESPAPRAVAPEPGKSTTVSAAPIIRSGATAASHKIDQIYCDGTLYRLETPAENGRKQSGVPAPHFLLPPRNSPRRSVRKSLLKLLSSQSALPGGEPAAERAGSEASARRRTLGRDAQVAPERDELPGEIIFDEPHTPQTSIESAPAFEPVLPPLPISPPAAPLNLAEEFGPSWEVRSPWNAAEAESAGLAFILLPPPADMEFETPLVELPRDVDPSPDSPAEEEPIGPKVSLRLDAAHSAGMRRPHARFAAPIAPAETAEQATAPVVAVETEPAPAIEEDVTISDWVETPVALADETTRPELAEEHLTFADLDSDAAEATIAAAASEPHALWDDAGAVNDSCEADTVLAASAETEKLVSQRCLPQWEVDSFHWPDTCQKLLADRDGYLSKAGAKLLAAVRDGMRTLAVTGSRRGEGRSTLALCLAHVAAQAGINVALMDADFARPQLAAKLGLEAACGWHDAALGHVSLSEAAVKSLSDQLTVFPLEAAAVRTGLSLADPRVTATLRATSATFDLVILDMGPLAASDDIVFPAGEACPIDALIVVRDMRYASATESEAVGKRLYAAGVEAVGIAENFVSGA